MPAPWSYRHTFREVKLYYPTENDCIILLSMIVLSYWVLLYDPTEYYCMILLSIIVLLYLCLVLYMFVLLCMCVLYLFVVLCLCVVFFFTMLCFYICVLWCVCVFWCIFVLCCMCVLYFSKSIYRINWYGYEQITRRTTGAKENYFLQVFTSII